ncbi:MAG: helix-turn-helix domain-containing protein [Thermoanaerobaculia bacterium]
MALLIPGNPSAQAQLRAARALLDITQEECGNLLEVTGDWVASIEASRNFPSLELAIKMQDLFGIDVALWRREKANAA